MVRFGEPPFPSPESERQELVNQLCELGTLVPDAAVMPMDQLRGIVAWQKESAAKDELVRAAAEPFGTSMPEEDIKEALKEISAYRKKKVQ